MIFATFDSQKAVHHLEPKGLKQKLGYTRPDRTRNLWCFSVVRVCQVYMGHLLFFYDDLYGIYSIVAITISIINY